ncbi:alpha/beta fold hydrolase [Aeromicrobium wangtongii]|uniref:Alpha/beta hydrolase n=1 Tax=Aeromicrobium wangtongii TaxID=2969247 RepID=A0ABY5ME98_9ACTN|nr:alpha/beta hydrolase [Aeromicrobium wangtongii]MCD9197756.1 alpha/beta hydrolase [Aeromicrobium wangtongii]UUP15239.1 alpha/beta hydrolase [Aeromicrobium wangtongii]
MEPTVNARRAGDGIGTMTASAYLETGVRLHYYDCGDGDDTLVLLHGYPQTAWQWRHVLGPLADAGYRVIAPDYRGAGHSSRPSDGPGRTADLRGGVTLPRAGYSKWTMAEDIHLLLHEHLGLRRPAFVLGLDIGSMVATAYAFRYRDATRALGYGEASQPGTAVFDRLRNSAIEWHYNFHALLDLPEALVAGRERLYLQYFFDRHAARPMAVDTDAYATAYAQAGAMRAGFDLYRAFDQDADDIRAAVRDGGKLTIPCLGLYGTASLAHADAAEDIGRELADDVTVVGIADAGHWIAEENPEALVESLLKFDGRRT